MRRTKFFVWLIAAVLVCLMGPTALVNILGDPYYRLFYKRAELQSFSVRYVDTLVNTKFGLPYVEHDRPIKRALAQTPATECYALGSSEGMGLSPLNFPPARNCRSFHNLSVALGTFEDMLAFGGMIARQPEEKRLFLVMSPWFFRTGYNNWWKSLADDVARGSALLDPPSTRRAWADAVRVKLEALADALSVYYLPISMRAVWRGADPALVIAPLDTSKRIEARDGPIFKPDGSYVFQPNPIERRLIPPRIPRGTINRAIYEPEMFERWVRIIENLRAARVEVTLIIPPYHPDMWRCDLANVCAAFTEVERRILALAKAQNVTLYGTYDSRTLGLAPQDFLDLNHIDPEHFLRIAAFKR